MSQPISRYLHPFDGAGHPNLEPEVKRAIVASWVSDRTAIPEKPSLRRRGGRGSAVSIEHMFCTSQSWSHWKRSVSDTTQI